jgi:hypothetical protein
VTELSFKGKEFVYNHHLAVPFRPLVPDERKGIGPVALDGNLIIHGDNLHALKALLPLYAGKVDCIYIDPPYNTGAWDDAVPAGELELVKNGGESVRAILILMSEWRAKLPGYLQ